MDQCGRTELVTPADVVTQKQLFGKDAKREVVPRAKRVNQMTDVCLSPTRTCPRVRVAVRRVSVEWERGEGEDRRPHLLLFGGLLDEGISELNVWAAGAP